MMWGAQLVLAEDGVTGRKRVSVVDLTWKPEPSSLSDSYRTSPIYAAAPKGAELPQLDGECRIAFITCDETATEISRLSNCLPSSIQRHLFFSLGIPSIVLFYSPSEEDVVKSHLGTNHRAIEIWKIESGILDSTSPWVAPPVPTKRESFKIVDSVSERDFDATQVLLDIQHHVLEYVSQASRHCPSALAPFSGFVQHVNRIAADYDRLTAELVDESNTVALCDRQKNLNALMDLLIQINSALAYVNSQAFSGTTPLLEKRCLFQGHSLLGIGMAVKALNAFGSVVANAFSKIPVYETLRELTPAIAGFDPSTRLSSINDVLRHAPKFDVDELASKTPSEESKPHLFFFSGRLGFQEAHFAVSAAMQTLFAADTIRWSLMTFSHELMHAHVREILGAIFSDVPLDSPGDLARFHEQYVAFLRNGFDPRSHKLIDSLRFSIFNYCLFRDDIDRRVRVRRESANTTHSDRAGQVIPTLHDLHLLLIRYYRDINELIVHVLDFNYFYHRNATLYLNTLWKSWSTVPSVLVNLEHYILRSLAAISTKKPQGTASERFDYAFREFSTVIEGLHSQNPSNALLALATEYLNDEQNKRLLGMQFLAAAYLGNIANCYMRSSQLHALLDGVDAFASMTDDGPHYALEHGEFPTKPVESILSFLVDRLRRSLNAEANGDELLYRSAWVFVIAASYKAEDTNVS